MANLEFLKAAYNSCSHNLGSTRFLGVVVLSQKLGVCCRLYMYMTMNLMKRESLLSSIGVTYYDSFLLPTKTNITLRTIRRLQIGGLLARSFP